MLPIHASTAQHPDAHQLAAEIKNRARHLGFDRVGIAPATGSSYREFFEQWLNDGQGGEMSYLKKRLDERTDPSRYLPGARSVVCVAINYYVRLRPVEPADAAYHGRVARYALGEDYHELIKTRLHDLADWIRRTAPAASTRACIDTAPVMEKELAARAGVGWFGKNGCIINEQIGSWLLLGEIITTLALPEDEPATDRCGTCRRCIDACPTQAITEPYRVDARRCISYLTIEHRGDVPAELRRKMGDWVYGCDICQEVCPWNSHAPAASDPALSPRFETGTLDVRELLGWTPEEYRARLRGSAMKRAKLPVLQRNAGIVLENLRPRGEAS